MTDTELESVELIHAVKLGMAYHGTLRAAEGITIRASGDVVIATHKGKVALVPLSNVKFLVPAKKPEPKK